MQLEDKKRSTVSCVILILIFAFFICFFAIGTYLKPKREYSELENRSLASFPSFSLFDFLSGDLSNRIESYFSDHIILRDEMVTCKSTVQYLCGQTYENGVFWTKDGYILKKYIEDTKTVDENITYINEFAAEQDVDVDFILAPNSITLNSDKLSNWMYTQSQLDTISHIKQEISNDIELFDTYSLLSELKEQGVQTYYRTDHHWTANSAKAVAEQWLSRNDYDYDFSNYDYITCDGFYGSQYYVAPNIFITPDTFDFYSNPDGEYVVDNYDLGTTTNTLINDNYVDVERKYQALLDGDYSLVKVTSNCDSGKSLLIVKDSFSRQMITFLSYVFSEIYLVDPRYVSGESVLEISNQVDADRILFIYSVETINEEHTFNRLTESF